MKVKKEIIILFSLVLLLNLSFILAEPAVPGNIGDQDVEKIQNVTSQFPIKDDGSLDVNKTMSFKSKAEERIKSINQWLADNAAWLKVVFGMVPEISWLFAINLYILLFFFVSLVLNGDSLWIFLSEGYAKIFGLVVFIILDITKFFTNVLAIPSHAFFSWLWAWFWSWGWIIAVLFIILLIIVLFAIMIYFPAILVAVHSALKARKKKNEEEKEKNNRKALGALVKGIQEGS